ncbi:unnamed protein product, partial [Nesidiocoris tenuis]
MDYLKIFSAPGGLFQMFHRLFAEPQQHHDSLPVPPVPRPGLQSPELRDSSRKLDSDYLEWTAPQERGHPGLGFG